MNDKVREEFEEWMAAGAGVERWKVQAARTRDGGYALRTMNIAWDSWKASREALVIELPPLSEKGEPDIFGNPGEWVKTAAGYKDACEVTLKKAGLKVKP